MLLDGRGGGPSHDSLLRGGLMLVGFELLGAMVAADGVTGQLSGRVLL